MAHSCSGAFGDDWTPEEIERMIARLEDVLARKRQENPDADPASLEAEVAAEVGGEALRGRMAEMRMRRATALARRRRDAKFEAMTGLSEDKRLQAFNVGNEARIAGAGQSVDAQGRALLAEWSGGMRRDLIEAGVWDRFARAFGRDKAFEQDIMNEMARLNGGNGRATGNADARQAAEIINRYIEQTRIEQNRHGAFIERLPGYIVRQSHDPMKISGGFFRGMGRKAREAARRKWIDDILPRLDARTFDNVRAERQRRRNLLAEGASARDVDPEGLAGLDDAQMKEQYLTRIWTDIVAGRHEQATGAMDDLDGFRPPPSTARSVSASRVLHFASADDFFEYNAQYGRGSLFDAIDGQMHRAARNAALMKNWGPNPRAAYDGHVQRAVNRARDAGDTDAASRLENWLREAEFKQLDGSADAPESVRLAAFTRGLLLQQQLSKLGGMTISAITDTSLAANTLARAGVNFLDSYDGLIKSIAGMEGAQARETADMLNVAARVMVGDVTGRHNALDGAGGVMSRMVSTFYRANLFTFWATRVRRGVGVILAKNLGNKADLAFDALDGGTQTQLERYGLNAEIWDALRANVTDGGPDMGRVITLDAADNLDGAAMARALGEIEPEGGYSARQQEDAVREVQLRLQAYFNDQTDSAMTEPRARERSAIRLNTQRGTPLGMAVEMFMQFKSFPTTVITRQLKPAMRGIGANRPVATFAHLIAASTALGYVAMQAKMIAAGLAPRPLTDEDGNPDLTVVAAAMVQGGGAGIYGDLLIADYNRYGQGAADTLGGPAVGEMTAILGVIGALRDGEDPGARAWGLAKRNTPFANLFYTRALTDYFFWHQMQEWASPGYMRRYERSLERDRNTRLLIEPAAGQ